MVNTDLVGFCCFSCDKCQKNALADLGPNCYEALLFFVKFRWLTECKVTGSKNYGQYPDCACWYNCPLCLGVCLLPGCCQAVYLRNMEQMTGQTCESQCLTCCVLTACCYMNMCYYASKRTAFREKYGLRGSPCQDCCCFCCSPLCWTCQDANELMNLGQYEVPFCGAKAASVIRGATGGNQLAAKVAEVQDKINDKVMQKVNPNRT